MSESLDPSAAAVNGLVVPQANGHVPKTPTSPAADDDIDEFLRPIIADLWWAEAQYALGEWDKYPLGTQFGVVNKQVWAFGFATDLVVQEAAEKAGVPQERVALFKVFDPTTF